MDSWFPDSLKGLSLKDKLTLLGVSVGSGTLVGIGGTYRVYSTFSKDNQELREKVDQLTEAMEGLANHIRELRILINQLVPPRVENEEVVPNQENEDEFNDVPDVPNLCLIF